MDRPKSVEFLVIAIFVTSIYKMIYAYGFTNMLFNPSAIWEFSGYALGFIVDLMLAYFIGMGKNWARITYVVVIASYFIISIVRPGVNISTILGLLAVASIIIYCLFNRKADEFFRKKPISYPTHY